MAMNEYYVNARSTCLRRYVGLRINIFRGMHDKRFYLDDDRTVIAARCDEYALTASIAYDQVFAYYYVRDCGWYRSDLSKLSDEEIPDSVQLDLLRQFASLLG